MDIASYRSVTNTLCFITLSINVTILHYLSLLYTSNYGFRNNDEARWNRRDTDDRRDYNQRSTRPYGRDRSRRYNDFNQSDNRRDRSAINDSRDGNFRGNRNNRGNNGRRRQQDFTADPTDVPRGRKYFTVINIVHFSISLSINHQ